MSKYTQVIGGSIEDAEKKFPRLKEAVFSSAVIDMAGKYLIWKSGTWKGGIWEGGIWKDGIWECGIWEYGRWEYGTWENGVWGDGSWEGGRSCLTRCKRKVSIDKDQIIIGCKSSTVKEWDEFFASDEVIETPRDTEAFNLIHRAYKIARYSFELDKERE